MRRVSLTFLSLLVTVGVFAQRGTCGNGISWKLTDETLTISGSGEMNDFNSSDHPSWDVYKDNITKVVVATGVTKIGTHAFEDYRNLRQITLNEGVETISECAFSGCTGIKELTLPQSIRVIKGTAFWGLGISTLTIPEGLETIEEGAFAACEKLTMVKWNAANCSLSSKRDSGPFSSGWNDNFSPVGEVVFGKNVTEIPNNLFYKCSSLKTVRTSGSISKVGRDAFTDTQWIDDQPEGIVNIDKALYEYKGVMTKVASIAIPEGMESITARVFENCKYLVGITLPTTLKSIGEGSFYGCTALGRIEWNSVECEDFTSSDQPFSETAIYEVVFGNQVKRIPDYAFFQCKGLEEVILPASVVSIGEGTFYDCDGLMHVEFGESLESIGKNAFYDCDKLESITLPEKLTFIAPGAFGSLENLKHVTFNAIDCHVSEGHFDTPVFTAPTRLETFVIGDNVTRIPYEICYGKGSFKEIVIPNSVKIIENRAFGGCGIESLTIGENVETMAGAFSDCSGLKELTWNAMRTENPESSNLRLIPSQTIEKLTLGEKVEEIPDYLCYNCTGLSDFTIPDGVKNIGREAFYNTGLTDMFVPASVTEMGWRAFGNNRQLRRVIIPSDEAARAEAPFSACSALEEIVVPDTAAFEKNDNWSAYSGIIKPMVSFSNHQFTYSGKLPETEITNNLTGYTLRLDLPELNKDAGTYTARAEASYDGPYPFSVSVPFKYRIDKARLTLTPANVEKVYGDMNPVIYEYTQEGLVNDETLEEAFEVLPEFSTNTDDRVQTGSYAIELANSPKAKNYDFFCGKGFMTVTPKPLHVTAVNVSRPYGENNPELELMYEGFAFDDDTLSLYRTPYAICDADNLSDAGEYEIRVSGGSGRNYTFDFTYGVLSVTPAVQKIEWEQEWPVLHVGDSIALYACATSGLPVSFATDSPDVCRIVHAENQYFIVCLTEGTARVQATQEGNSNWMAAENTERELSVEAAITGIEDNDINHPDVHADRKQIVVKGTINGTVINVYTLNGTQLHSEASRGNEHRLTMDQAGVYIVNVGGRSFKLTVE